MTANSRPLHRPLQPRPSRFLLWQGATGKDQPLFTRNLITAWRSWNGVMSPMEAHIFSAQVYFTDPSDAFDKLPFLVRLLVTLNRNFTPNLLKFLHLESHLSTNHLKTHPFEVSIHHIIDKRPSLKGWHGGWKTSTPSFNLSEKPIELQNRKLPKRAGPRHVCTTNSHLNDPIGSKLCFLHIPQAVWYQTWSYGERDTQQK